MEYSLLTFLGLCEFIIKIWIGILDTIILDIWLTSGKLSELSGRLSVLSELKHVTMELINFLLYQSYIYPPVWQVL